MLYRDNASGEKKKYISKSVASSFVFHKSALRSGRPSQTVGTYRYIICYGRRKSNLSLHTITAVIITIISVYNIMTSYWQVRRRWRVMRTVLLDDGWLYFCQPIPPPRACRQCCLLPPAYSYNTSSTGRRRENKIIYFIIHRYYTKRLRCTLDA